VREWGGDAAGVRIGLKELEDKAKGAGKPQDEDEEETERAASRTSNRRPRGSTSDKTKTKDASSNDGDAGGLTDGAMDTPPFYKSVEEAYTYANKTLLRVLMEDQMLVPRLRSVRHHRYAVCSELYLG
jgi:hypothetical protein